MEDIKAIEKSLASAGYVCGWHKPVECVGYIYVCVNRLFPGLVKIGYADDLEKRVRGLSNSSVPEPYHCYAAYRVVERLEDKALHHLIDELDPELRYATNKEFYTMEPDRAFSILTSIARISGTEDRLELNPLNDPYFSFSGSRPAPPSPITTPVLDSSEMDKLRTMLANGFNYKGMTMACDMVEKKFRWYQYRRTLPRGVGGSIHYEVWFKDNNIVDVCLHNEGSTDPRVKKPFANDLHAAAAGRTDLFLGRYSAKTVGVHITGRTAEDIYAEICEKMKQLYDLFQPIIDKYEKMYPVSQSYSNIDYAPLWKRLNALIEARGYHKVGKPLDKFRGDYFTVGCGIEEDVHLDVLAWKKGKMGMRIWYRDEAAHQLVESHKADIEAAVGSEVFWRKYCAYVWYDADWRSMSDAEIDKMLEDKTLPLIEKAKAVLSPFVK